MPLGGTRDAKANLKNGNIEKRTCKPVWNFVTVFEKKIFFVNFHEISRYRKILNRDFRPVGIEIRWFWIAQMKDWKIRFSMKKQFGGGGDRNRVKFHFEVLGNFLNLKMHGIFLISWIITIFWCKLLLLAQNFIFELEKFWKNFGWGSNYKKIEENRHFSKNRHVR